MVLRPVVLLTAAALAVPALAPLATADPTPSRTGATGRFVVTLAADRTTTTTAAAAARAEALGGTVGHIYTSALRGYAVTLPRLQVAVLLRDPQVLSVELDRTVQVTASQAQAPYGLDRIDQRALPLDGRYVYRSTGAGVTAYVVDTGIRMSHRQFGGRAVNGVDTVDGGSADDCNGHGTHVAGTLGGATYGVAKSVRLVAVKVLGCNGSGSVSDVIAGVDWVARHHRAGQPAVANLSISGSASSALDKAVQGAVADGVTVVVAAGNGNVLGYAEDACKVSPARVGEALTVGASDERDEAAIFSNYGSCVDLYAPGVDVVSAWRSSDTSVKETSGTSMASPHVAGVAALHLQRQPKATPAAVAAALLKASTKDAVAVAGRGGLLGGGVAQSGHLVFSGA